jgi:hypothetical protein
VKYTSTVDVKDERFPDVVVKLRKVSAGKRDEMRLAICKHLEELSEIIQEAEEFREGADDNSASAAKIQWYNARISSVSARVDHVRARALVKSIDGLEIDGAPATIDSLIDSGDEDLFEVVSRAVKHEMGLDRDEQKNSPRPTTSQVVEDGPTNPTSAETASETATT